MNILIIVHSKSGNSLKVAKAIKHTLNPEKYKINLKHIEANKEDELDISKIKIPSIPNVKPMDVVIIGGPVRGFAASPATMKAIASVNSFKNKKIVLYVTQFFPSSLMGGNKALKQMKEAVELKGGEVVHMKSIQWYNFGRNIKIMKFVRDLTLKINS